MIRYVKGLPKDQVEEELIALEEGFPKMITAQYAVFELLSDYLKGEFFKSEDSRVLGKKAKGRIESIVERYARLNHALVSRKDDVILIGMRD